MRRAAAPLLVAALAACASPPRWQDDVVVALRDARAAGAELVAYFALPGREASDRMQRQLQDPAVLQALADGGFRAAIVDGDQRKGLYAAWIGGGEGMGLAVLDADGRCYAARPGPQDPPEIAAMLRLCATMRARLPALRRKAALGAPEDAHALGCALLQLGNRIESEALLTNAAVAGVVDARHRLARLFALDGDLVAARRWLTDAPRTGPALVTEGYVLFKERKHLAAAAVFERALARRDVGDDRQRALLYLGKSLHEARQDARAVPLLEALSREGTGSTFEAGALHTLSHIRNPQDNHSH
ncbi:MAG: hypothetical protein FJ301_09025 [Planctomycetes bacterium]|nr:hypothetical protein [Planctomycetota bacterium]